MTTSRHALAIACLGLAAACASSPKTEINSEPSTRFRDLAAVVIADSGEARPIRGTGNLRYPDDERRRNIEASFAFAFLLGTDGRVEYETVTFLTGAPPAFFDEACLWLRSQRFVPVQRQGTLHRSLVVSDLTFTLDRSNNPGSAPSGRRALPVNVQKHRRELAAMDAVALAGKLERHRHCA